MHCTTRHALLEPSHHYSTTVLPLQTNGISELVCTKLRLLGQLMTWLQHIVEVWQESISISISTNFITTTIATGCFESITIRFTWSPAWTSVHLCCQRPVPQHSVHAAVWTQEVCARCVCSEEASISVYCY